MIALAMLGTVAATFAIGGVLRAAWPALILHAAERDLARGPEGVRRTGLHAAGVAVTVLVALSLAATLIRG